MRKIAYALLFAFVGSVALTGCIQPPYHKANDQKSSSYL